MGRLKAQPLDEKLHGHLSIDVLESHVAKTEENNKPADRQSDKRDNVPAHWQILEGKKAFIDLLSLFSADMVNVIKPLGSHLQTISDLLPENKKSVLLIDLLQDHLHTPMTIVTAASFAVITSLGWNLYSWELNFLLRDIDHDCKLSQLDLQALVHDLCSLKTLLNERRRNLVQKLCEPVCETPLTAAVLENEEDSPFLPSLLTDPILSFKSTVEALNLHHKLAFDKEEKQHSLLQASILVNTNASDAIDNKECTCIVNNIYSENTKDNLVTLEYFIAQFELIPALFDLGDQITMALHESGAYVHDSAHESSVIQTLVALNSPKLHDDCYIISLKWWRLWIDYVGLDDQEGEVYDQNLDEDNELPIQPGPIDNRDLLIDNDKRPDDVRDLRRLCVLADNLADDKDFISVSIYVWRSLHRWYGGGPPIVRRLVYSRRPKRIFYLDTATSLARSMRFEDHEFVVDLYPLIVHVAHLNTPDKLINCVCSSQSTLQELLITIQQQLDLTDLTFTELFTENDKPLVNISVLESAIVTLDECGIVHRQVILCGKTLIEYDDNASTTVEQIINTPIPEINSKRKGKGLVGLYNLGNTCYMNAALQCLSNLDPFVDYFFSANFIHDNSVDNLLHTKHKSNNKNDTNTTKESIPSQSNSIVKPFVELLRELWNTEEDAVLNPLSLRTELVRRCPDFGGISEHDSQELLSLLLDCLHEELNLVQKKPNITAPDYNPSVTDNELAKLWWSNHLQREQSVVVTLFQVSLPQDLYREFSLKVVLLGDDEPPIACTVRVNTHGTIDDMITVLRRLCRKFAYRDFVITDTRGSYIFQVFRKTRGIADLNERYSLTAYQIDAGMTRSVSLMEVLSLTHTTNRITTTGSVHAATRINIIHRRLKEEWRLYGKRLIKPILYGLPLYAAVPHQTAQLTGTELYNYVMSRIRTTFGYVCTMGTGTNGSLSASTSPTTNLPTTTTVSTLSSATTSKTTLPASPISKGILWRSTKSPASSLPLSSSLTTQQISSGSVYPFVLKMVDRAGSTCSKCPSAVDCTGCRIAPIDTPLTLSNNDTIAIEWKKSTRTSAVNLVKIFSRTVPLSTSEDNNEESVKSEQRNRRSTSEQHKSNDHNEETVSLDDILQEYEKVEKLTEGDFYCSKCKCQREAFRRETIFRLPPILLVHIKRFTYDRTGCVKSDKTVHIPLNVDLTRYLTEVVERRAPFPISPEFVATGTLDNSTHSTDHEKDTTHYNKSNTSTGTATATTATNFSTVTITNVTSVNQNNTSILSFRDKSPSRSSPTSIQLTPDQPPSPRPSHKSHTPSPRGSPSPVLTHVYDLTATINHIGTSYSGHYFVATKRPNEPSWRLFNDNKICKDISDRDVTLSESAYVLFYSQRSNDLARVQADFEVEKRQCDEIAEQVRQKLKLVTE